ncbi:class II fructose-1,6-bisphosphate aldolase [candidate division KSB3 bacterium]|uniref:fructose-bisphosphate aldolase n=1 Tax=candidate division KSB3 bacterium TaxID=2044937 RepID=A0A9D5JUR4_9BACT|nr:class II fructose-1,6-bisphosphate aldolase [candidate division KSB3 bacterium]MBD3324530.1 class II fructose-1,6-bisphosphate aldolase [candidate division KSB3 bacterium]
MPLVTSKELFKKAYDGGYAIGGFNVNNMELLQGIVEAGNEERSPLILQVSAGARKYANPVYLRKLVEAALDTTDIPIVLHLDHGDSFEMCKDCVDDGFTSVMIDASKYPFEKNIEISKQVAEYAHARGVVVEAELGKLAGIEDAVNVAEKDAIYTDPEQVAEFVEKTGVDSLAIAIGTSHGAYKFKGEPQLDFERLYKIEKMIPGFPIVLHGSSSVPQELVEKCNQYGGQLPGAKGVPEDMLREAAKSAVCKINIDTDLRLAMTSTIREVFAKSPELFDPRKYLGPGRDAVRELVRHKLIDVLGSAGKA